MRGKIKPGVTYGMSCFTHGQPLPLFKLAVFWSPVSRAEGEFTVRVKGTRKAIETMDRIGCKGISRKEGMDSSRLNNGVTAGKNNIAHNKKKKTQGQSFISFYIIIFSSFTAL